MQLKIFFVIAALFSGEKLMAQVPAEGSDILAGADVVYTNYERKLTFTKKDGIPVAESEYSIDMLMLTDKTSNMVSRYKVAHNGYSELAGMEAYTKVPLNNNKYKTIKVNDFKTSNTTQDNIFSGDTKESVFDFPSLSQNSIAHLEYKLSHKDIHLVMPFYIPDELPVISAVFTVVVPSDIRIKYLVKNDESKLFQFSEESKGRTRVYKWTRKNIKATDNYTTAPDFRYFEPHIIVYVSDYDTDKGKSKEKVFGTVDDLYKWSYSFLKNINQEQHQPLNSFIDSLTREISSPYDKAAVIYDWVKKSIKYIAFESGEEGFRPRNAPDIYIKRYGDCKDMASLLTYMMKKAGLDAHYTWIGTRDIPYRYEEIPLPIVDNHMISSVRINDKWYFLDATNSYATLDLPPSSIQDKEALVSFNEKEFKIIKVPVAEHTINTVTDSTFISFTPEGIKGFEKVSYTGYFAQDIFNSLSYKNEKQKEDYAKSRMSKGSNKFIFGKYKIDMNEEDNQAFISADFRIPDYSKKIDSEYYINLNLEKLMEGQLVDIEKRKVAIQHEYKFQIRSYHILDIPENYKIKFIPEDFEMENDLMKVSIRYKVENNRIIACQEVINKKLMVATQEFPAWNQPVKSLMSQYNKSVVLVKK